MATHLKTFTFQHFEATETEKRWDEVPFCIFELMLVPIGNPLQTNSKYFLGRLT